MSPVKGPSLDILIESLLQEASKTFQETKGLEWEWEHYLKLYNLINQIQAKEAARDTAAGDVSSSSVEDKNSSDIERRKSKIEPFIKWLNENKVNTAGLEIKDVGAQGLGVITTVARTADEPVFAIPDRVMITTTNARQSKLQILAEKDPIIRSMPNILLSLFLLFEKYITREASFWKPYIDILPSSYETVQYFTMEDMTLLKHYTNGFRDSLRMYRNILRQYAYFHNVFRKSTDSASRLLRTIFTYKKYAWCTATAMTRQNSLSRPGEVRDDMCLIPMWDMANHEDTGTYSNTYDPEHRVLICFAGRDFEANSEFKFYYGHRGSLDHFTHGGFVPDSQMNDLYNLELGIGSNDPNFARKQAILKKYDMKTVELFPMKPAYLNEQKGVIIFLKVFLANSEILDNFESKLILHWSFMEVPDEKIWQFLMTRFAILAKASENAKSKLIAALSAQYQEKPFPYRAHMILQLLKNEHKLLELLSHCAKDLGEQAAKDK